MQAREPPRISPFRPVMIRIGVDDPARPSASFKSIQEPTFGLHVSVRAHYMRYVPVYFLSAKTRLVDAVELGCFDGIPARRSRGARRRAITDLLEDALAAYRAYDVPCSVNRVLDTRMTGDEYDVAVHNYPTTEGSRIDEECAASPREAGNEIECPLCGAGTTMARRGDYPWDGQAKAGAAKWRSRGLAGEPRPTLQWVRPHGKCEASNSHSLVILPAGAPRAGRTGGFVLVRAFGEEDRIPHVYEAD